MLRRWFILALVAYPLLAQILSAQEAVTPDSIAAQSGYTDCTIGEIDEDPDSSGTDWCDTGDANNITTEVRATFNTPSGSPSGTQEFRVQLRKTSQSTNPSCRVDLYENGSEVTQGVIADTTISATSEVVLSGNWNASSLGTADGSLVEIYVLCTPGGGNPNNRASGEVGAVEWIATTAQAPATGSGTITTSLNASAIGEEIVVGSATITSTLTPSAIGEEIVLGTATITSSLTPSAVGQEIVVGSATITASLSASVYTKPLPRVLRGFRIGGGVIAK